MLKQRGDIDEAELWYRRAVEAGNRDAMNNLGVLLAERGDLGEAELWYRRAAEAGNRDAMNNLGVLLKQHGHHLVVNESWSSNAFQVGKGGWLRRIWGVR
ncbi:tetratricopeptide repeat protein [Nocardia sp. NPDC003726]